MPGPKKTLLSNTVQHRTALTVVELQEGRYRLNGYLPGRNTAIQKREGAVEEGATERSSFRLGAARIRAGTGKKVTLTLTGQKIATTLEKENHSGKPQMGF